MIKYETFIWGPLFIMKSFRIDFWCCEFCSPGLMEHSKYLYNIFGFYVQFLPLWVTLLYSSIILYCSFFFALLDGCCWVILGDCRVMNYISMNKKEIETELKALVKLCRWDCTKSYLSMENLRKIRLKLRKLVQKFTVSLKLFLFAELQFFLHHLFSLSWWLALA